MKLKLIKEAKIWKSFLKEVGPHSFLQSWEWGQFQKEYGFYSPSFWLLFNENAKPILGASFLSKNYPILGKEINSARSLLYLKNLSLSKKIVVLDTFLKKIKGQLRHQNATILKLEPSLIEENNSSSQKQNWEKVLQENNFNLSHSRPLQPRRTLILNLTPSLEDILAQMKSKTRYNVRLAERKGVKIKVLEKPNWDNFYGLMKTTAQRNDINIHHKKYFQTMGGILAPLGMLKMLEAWYKDTLLSSILLIFYNKRAVYLYGASNNKHRNLMANYLMHYRAFALAKEKGCTSYDFWGISDGTKYTESWQGLTRFKKGFGGQVQTYFPQYSWIPSPVKNWAIGQGRLFKKAWHKLFS